MNQKYYLRSTALIGAAAIALSAAPAIAQDEEAEDRDWIVSLGAGGRVSPKYLGADNYGITLMPIFGLQREGDPLPIEAPDEGAGFGVLNLLGNGGAFDFGPTVQFQGERDEEDVGAPVGEVDFTVEVGAFAQVLIGDSFRLRAEGRKGLGGHDGWTGDIMADFVLRDEGTYVFTIGPRARWGDNTYQDAYFSVTPGVAAAAGLPVFDADDGFYAAGVYSSLTYMLSRNWGLYTYAGYDRLVGDAADSPIVRAFGSRDQFSGGVGFFYSFNAGNLFGG